MDNSGFVDQLLTWYRTVRRDLPWRENSDPYRIWVSEVMLQQTRVEAVISYYQRFMERFPTLSDLAQASEDQVLKLWEGLGYYSRARNLHKAVREVESRYGGVLPDSYDDLSTLPGVGSYTAGAVLSIAYGQSIPAVDGNVARIMARLWGITDDVSSGKVRLAIETSVRSIIPSDHAGDFNQALMELGALVCVPRNPKCEKCPVFIHCEAYKRGSQSDLPRKRMKKTRSQELHVAVLIQAGDAVCVRRRPAKGLLAGLWELPTFPVACATLDQPDISSPDFIERVKESAKGQTTSELARHGVKLADELVYLGQYEHVFTHLSWTVLLFGAKANEAAALAPYRFASGMDRSRMAFGRIWSKMLMDRHIF